MLRVDVITIFPRMLEGCLGDGIVHRAREAGLVSFGLHDLRTFTDDRHRTTDDAPFGGGPGMVMKAEPFFRAIDALLPAQEPPRARSDREQIATPEFTSGVAKGVPGSAIVLLSPRGRPFDQATAARFATLDRLVLLCGRYEGIDERVREGVATEEISLGDFVLTGGEVAALAVIEATVRLLPGALGDQGSAEADSFSDGLLDCPHYTRPATVRGRPVPDALVSGDHGRIRRWRRKEALRATRERRPDLLRRVRLTPEDEVLLREIDDEKHVTASAAIEVT
jgi:tRNA (guanine37-N1)-methyltransferase